MDAKELQSLPAVEMQHGQLRQPPVIHDGKLDQLLEIDSNVQHETIAETIGGLFGFGAMQALVKDDIQDVAFLII